MALNGGTVRHHLSDCSAGIARPAAPSVGPGGLVHAAGIEEFQRPPRWDRATPAFEWVSKRAW